MTGKALSELSARQLEVLELICQGYPSSLISKQLNISFETVKSHRSAIMRRMEVSNTVALVNKYNQYKAQVDRTQTSRAIPTLMVVEDDLDFRALLVSSLAQLGFQCSGVENRRELELAIKKNLPDIVILDLNLGPDDGLEIARMLREQTRCGIVIMTTRGMVESRIDGLAVGADAYLVKPVDIRELTGTIKNLYSRLNP